MAIRPSDLQGAIFQSAQSAPLTQRAEEAPRVAAMAAQAAFADQLHEREETVQTSGEAEGNKVDPRGERERQQPQGRKRRHEPGEPFDDTVAEAAGFDEPPHLIDFTA